MARSVTARELAGIPDHVPASKVALAAATASLTSAAVPPVKFANTPPVAGLIAGRGVLEGSTDETNAPLM